MHPLLHQQARPSAADLTLVEPDRIDHPLDDGIEVGVLVHDEGRLPAEFEREFLPAPGGRLPDDPSHLGGPGEGDLVDAAVLDERRPGPPVASDQVQHARREPGLMRQLREEKRRQRRVLGGFEHPRVPRRERRRDLPREHQQRKVPRDHLPHHTHRAVALELGGPQLRPPRVMVEVPRDQWDVEVTRLADRLPVVEGFKHREEAAVLLHHPSQRVEVPGPRMRGEPCPGPERLPRRGDGGVDILRRALRDAREPRVRARVGDVERRPRLRPRPADEMPEHRAMAGEPRARLRIPLGRGAVVHCLEDLGHGRHRRVPQGIG